MQSFKGIWNMLRELLKYFHWTLLLLVFCTYSPGTSGAEESPTNLSKHPILIIVSYDGFRHDYMSKTQTPYLDWVKENGVSVPYMRIQAATLTYPNHQSIATGLHVESHGIVGNSVVDPAYGKRLKKDEPGYWNFSHNHEDESSPIVPLYTLNQLAGEDRHSGSMMWPAGQESWGEFDTVVTHLMHYNDTMVQWEVLMDQVVDWLVHPTKPANLVFVYIEEPDTTGHEFGPESKQVKEQIERIDNVTGHLLDKLRSLEILDKVNMIFLSDHGMQEIKPLTVAHFLDVIDNTNNSVYHDYGRGSTFLQVVPNNPNDTLEIFKAFEAVQKQNHYSVYLKDGINSAKPHWRFQKSRRIQPIFMFADPGYIFEGTHPRNYTWGMHGFEMDHMSMQPFFLAMGPAFKNNSVEEPFDNVDIYPLACHILNLKPAGHNDGSMKNVLPLLKPETIENIKI